MPKNIYWRGGKAYARFGAGGREYRRSLRTKDPQEARRRLKLYRKQVEDEALFGDGRHSFEEAALKWEAEFLSGAVSPATAARYLVSVRQLDLHFAGLVIEALTVKDVSCYVSMRLAQKPRPSNATIRRDLTALSSILRAAMSWGWRHDNPARAWDRGLIRERRRVFDIPSDDAVSAMIARAAPWRAPLIRLLAETGMRQSEALSLKWEQVDLEARTIRLLNTKGRLLRVVAIAPDTASWLGKLPRHLTCRNVFWRMQRAGKAGPLLNFASHFAALNRGRKRLKEPDLGFRCHDLRHRFAVLWLVRGGDLYALSRHLGHSSVKVTEGYLRWLSTADPAQIAALTHPDKEATA